MKSVRIKKNSLKIDYKSPDFREKYTSPKYKFLFDWVAYKKHYSDLNVNNFAQTWDHWCNHGINERRIFYICDSTPETNLFEMIENLKTPKQSETAPYESKSILKNYTTEPNNSSSLLQFANQENDAIRVQNGESKSKGDNYETYESKKVMKKETKEDPKLNKTKENDKQLENTLKHSIKNKKINEQSNRSITIDYQYAEEVKTKIKLFNIKNVILKSSYSDYGVQYYGWHGVINQFMEFIKDENKDDDLEFNSENQYLFDEWLEKLMVWGNEHDSNYILSETVKNNYNIITFLHNPPFSNWYNMPYRSKIINKIIYNSKSTNKHVFEQLERFNLKENITYLYSLSNHHKEYLYNKCTDYKHKIVSVLHPIDLNPDDKKFDITLFNQSKQIIHVGWALKNFECFVNFFPPKEFTKTILIKKGFESEWTKISRNLNLNDITILKELKNNEYEKLFTNACIFVNFEDCVASNVILECIKFNTPIIVNKLPSVVEYLGEDYPLYYNTLAELSSFKNPKFLTTQVDLASQYLSKMNKSHVSLDIFNKKVFYDLTKLKVNLDTYKLTWICPIKSMSNIFNKIQNLYNNFISQNNNKQIVLKIIIDETLYDHEDYDAFVKKLDMYEDLVHNISYDAGLTDNLCTFYTSCFKNCDTTYLTFVDIDDEYDINFSDTNIEYLNGSNNCDISFCSYISNNSCYKETFTFKKDMMIFKSNFSNSLLANTGIVYRTNIIDILNSFQNLSDSKYIFREFHSRAISSHLNLMSCSGVPLVKQFINK
jgi:hypothetical protein